MQENRPYHRPIPTFLPFRGPFSLWPKTSDAVLAVLVFLASAFVPSDNKKHDDELILRTVDMLSFDIILLISIAALALCWRRSHPLVVLAITLSVMMIGSALGLSTDFFGVPIVLYSVGRYELNDRLSQLGGSAIGLVALVQWFDQTETLTDIGFSFLILFICWYSGRRMRARREYMELLRDYAEKAEREKEYESERAVSAERVRIARELHDVVAHQVSLMTIQASAAKTVAAKDLEKAINAMSAVETAGREALIELRSLLSVMRQDERNKSNDQNKDQESKESYHVEPTEQNNLRPQPGLSDLPSLIDSFQKAGLNIQSSSLPLNIELPSILNLAIYRIIQESLTNVIKHAGKNSKAIVSIEISDEVVNLKVENDHVAEPPTENDNEPNMGYGIIGMKERASSLQGRFDASFKDPDKFIVTCSLPFNQESSI